MDPLTVSAVVRRRRKIAAEWTDRVCLALASTDQLFVTLVAARPADLEIRVFLLDLQETRRRAWHGVEVGAEASEKVYPRGADSDVRSVLEDRGIAFLKLVQCRQNGPPWWRILWGTPPLQLAPR